MHLTMQKIPSIHFSFKCREFQNYKLTEKSHVYSFGVVLLEILTGQPPYVVSMEKTHIVQWVALKLQEGDIGNIIDPSLEGHFDESVARKMMEVALSCTSTSAERRITMSNAVVQLKQCLEKEVSQCAIEDVRTRDLLAVITFGSDSQPLHRREWYLWKINLSLPFVYWKTIQRQNF